ncbi:alginate lyase family protein [Alteromonas sp. 5E99-2]|uniref:alginate lyase family protein n=1 Tax=Alteromonas sp. 5E99-2 TaxID=2817683 RepID=UPI001A990011|nr:alginate lyase family protein [Alteromonas sp. 5E99-2]MBO1254713.1 alginate lyase family protein [Alteromonas sp. 5E99-2]
MLIRNSSIAIFLFLLIVPNAFAKFVVVNETRLAEVKTRLQTNTAPEPLMEAYSLLIEHADTLLTGPNYSVINKKISPPSNDPHDYLSISRYWWPDESKPDGLPWVRKDGITNPDTQTDHVDRKRLGAMTHAVRTLSLAYYLSGNEHYAEKAETLIRTWFLDKKTKMNPHLSYAQSVPGNDKLRRSGILDGRLISLHILDSIEMISTSSHWSKKNNKAMNRWLKDYLKWLNKSKLGTSGAKQTNNHGAWYFFQVSAIAWYLDDTSTLKSAHEKTQKLIQKQFDENGAQHHELDRTRPYFYSNFNLQALTSIAIVDAKADLPLWSYPSIQSSTLSKGVEFLIPPALGQPWTYSSKPIDKNDLLLVLSRYLKNVELAADKRIEYQKIINQGVEKVSTQQKKKGPSQIQYQLLSGEIFIQ